MNLPAAGGEASVIRLNNTGYPDTQDNFRHPGIGGMGGFHSPSSSHSAKSAITQMYNKENLAKLKKMHRK